MFSMNTNSFYLASFESFVCICVIVVTNVNCQNQNEQNIAGNNVIIITEEVSGDSTDSSFGYTVSLLKNYNNLPENGRSTGWVFVGAPKGEDGGAITYREHRREPGVIWRCSLGGPEEEIKDSCQMLGLQPISTHYQEQCYQRGNCQYKENQTGGWFGGSMNAVKLDNYGHPGSYGSLVGCAHRGQRIAIRGIGKTATVDDLVNGVCYWVQQDNLSAKNLQNLRGKKLVPLAEESTQRQFYLVSEYDKYGQWKSSTQDYEYHYGQAGFSSHLTKENNLLLGAPGVHTWSGSVIYYEGSDSQPEILKPEVYPSQIGILDLVCYTVTSGKFAVGSETMLAVGAPRAKRLLGSVIILKKPTYGFNVNSVFNVLVGDQLGAYFGSVLCAVDIDYDQSSDIYL